MLSIVVPALNESKYLPRLLESLRHQSFQDFEIIIADAGSLDETCAIAQEYGCRLVPGGKPARGRNEGARHARGDCFLFLDADVTLEPAFLQLLLQKMQSMNLDAASGFITPDSPRIVDRLLVWGSNIFNYLVQLHSPHASGFYIAARRSLHEKIGGFDESLKLTEDHDYVRRASRAGKFRYLLEPRVKFSVRRFDKEGRFALILKFSLLEIFMALNWPEMINKVSYAPGGFTTAKTVRPAEAVSSDGLAEKTDTRLCMR